MKKLSVVINVMLELECPEEIQTYEQACEYAQNYELPKEYKEDTFEFIGVYENGKKRKEVTGDDEIIHDEENNIWQG